MLGALKLTTAAMLALTLSACSPPPPKFKATDITGSSVASGFDLPGNIGGGFELVDHNGKTRRFEEFRGKLVIVFFGFTSCPDVCPTTLHTLAQTMKKLGPGADAIQVIMITVDPARDTQEVMSKYVPAFDPRFIGLLPSEEALKQVAAQFKAFYARNKPGTTLHDALAPPFSSNHRWWNYLLIAGLIGALDQAVKYAVVATMPYRASYEITPFFNLVHVWNTGAAFNFLADAGGCVQSALACGL